MTVGVFGKNVLIVATAILLADPFLPLVRAALRKDIREDTVWEGQISISTDIAITGATVRVKPGTTIRFVAPGSSGPGPVILLNSPSRVAGQMGVPAKLILAGTRDRPIVVETPPGKPRGAIAAGPATCASFIARHVVFRRLGVTVGATLAHPGVGVELASPDDDLWVSDCRFEECGPLRADISGPLASAEIARCSFTSVLGTQALTLVGAGQGPKVVIDNVADAGFRIECANTLLGNNVLVGDSAEISVPGSGVTACGIIGNYVHCTTNKGWGLAALKCDTAHALLQDNILIGGSYVAEAAPAIITGNVFVGTSGLDVTALPLHSVRITETHLSDTTRYLLANQARDAIITDNLFLGPAWASLAANRTSEGLVITNNVFDGWGRANRAIEFHAYPHQGADATVARNVITRYQLPPVVDAAGRNDTINIAGSNVFCEVASPCYDNIAGLDQLASGDLRLERFSELGYQNPPSVHDIIRFDDQLMKGLLSIAKVRRFWFDAYRLSPSSPVFAADPSNRPGPSPEAARGISMERFQSSMPSRVETRPTSIPFRQADEVIDEK